ncbi:MAG: ABC transporter substrate-binding protein [Geminicoccaceae bacterium]|nr:MAG: ABC transporter substrate-binding protein [Geminicoccaceae bacterium]
MNRFGLAVVTAAMLALSSVAAVAQERVFRFATTGDILGLDPHMHNHGTTNAVKGVIYGALLHRKPDLSLHPDLAVSWETLDDVTWEFRLREGVVFHDGTPFTASDVVYSFRRTSQPGAEMSATVASIEDVIAIDDYTVHIITRGPDPILLLNLPLFFIVSEQFMEANDSFQVSAGAGATNFANLNANGTGPYRLVEWVQDNRLVMVPNEDWWGHADRTDNIDRAIFMPIGNDATRVAALLSGEIDMMYPVPLQDVPRLEQTPNVEVMQGPELRTIFLGFDQHRDELMDMPGSGVNPFKDLRVRQAFAHALDLNAIQRVVMRGASTPTGSMIAPGILGFDEDIHVPYEFNPERSRELLAEAGFPDGFPVTLDCPNDRYVNDEAICTAVVPMLRRIGIDVTLNAQTLSLHFNKIGPTENYNTSFFMLGWTPGSYDALNVLQNLITLDGPAQGTWNSGRYTHPRIEELHDIIAVTVDPEERMELLREAQQIHKDDVGHLPLHQQALAWGVRTDRVVEIIQRPFNDVDLRYVTLR